MSQYRSFYAQYLDLPQGDEGAEGTFTSIRCPFEENHRNRDQKPSAGINFTNGVFNCNVCGAFSPGQFLSKILSIPMTQSTILVDEYRRDQKLVTKEEGLFTKAYIADPRWAELARRGAENLISLISEKILSEEDFPAVNFIQDYTESRGLTLSTLRELGVGYLPATETSWARSSIVFPYYMNHKVVGLRYRDFNGNKGGEKGCHFCLWGVDDLEDDTKLAILVEGETDRLRVYQELKSLGMGPDEGVQIVSSPTARFLAEWEREFEGIESKIFIPQADEPSSKMQLKVTQYLPDMQILKLPWRRRQLGKDTTEWLAYNQPEELKALILTMSRSHRSIVMNGYDFEKEALLEGEIEDKELICGLMQQGQICICGGEQKSYKTWFTFEVLHTLIDPLQSTLMGLPGLSRRRLQPYQVLFIEEEGSKREFYERAKKVLGGINGWQQSTHWQHRSEYRLEEESSMYKLEKKINDLGIEVIIFDPFSDLHGKDEDNATEMAFVWRNIKRLTTRFPDLVVWIIHHFGKGKAMTDKWNAFRGSSRSGQTPDFGVFIEKMPLTRGLGINFMFDGRSLGQLAIPEELTYYQANWNPQSCRLTFTTGQMQINRHLALLEEMKRRKTWTLAEAAEFFLVTPETIKKWIIDKLYEDIHPTAPAPGKPVTLTYVGKA